MRLGIVTLRGPSSFRNQADLIFKVGIQQGYEVKMLDMRDIVGPPKHKFDKLIALVPLWPRYIFGCAKLTTPWMSKSHVIYGPIDGPFQRNMALFNVMRNLRIVVPSQWCRDQIARSRVQVLDVVPHGIDHGDFEFNDKTRYTRLARLRKEYPKRTILFANLNPIHRKGFPHLCKAIELLTKKLGNKFIFIIHTGLKRASTIWPSLTKTPNVIVEDAYGQLPFRAIAEKTVACDIFVHPALLEGFGLPVLEAAAAGRTIVCLDSGPMTEIVGSKEAWLFPYHTIKEERWKNGAIAQLHEYNPEDLAHAMETAIIEKRTSQDKAKAAYEKSKNFDYRKVYGKLVSM